MNKIFNSTIISLVMIVGVGLVVTDAVGASHEVTMQFEVTRDVGIAGWSNDAPVLGQPDQSEQMSSAGTADLSDIGSQIQGTVRAVKSSQHAIIMDFDTSAMDTFLQNNPGTATWTFNLRNGPANGSQQQLHDVDITLQTVESTNDWAEGDALLDFANFNWTEGTAAATYFYAQTVYNLVGGIPVLDTAASLEWIDPDSGSYTFTTFGSVQSEYDYFGVPGSVGSGNSGVDFLHADSTPEFTNSENFTPAAVLAAFNAEEFATVNLDLDIVNALINDENNRGLKFGLEDGSSNQNWAIFTRECDSSMFGQCAPYLEVTIEPAAGSPGDFDNDMDVDGEDFLVWQRTLGDDISLGLWESNFGNTVSTASAAGVPEPSSMLLLLTCSSAMLCIRSRNLNTT